MSLPRAVPSETQAPIAGTVDKVRPTVVVRVASSYSMSAPVQAGRTFHGYGAMPCSTPVISLRNAVLPKN
jgi:hypothetical protein